MKKALITGVSGFVGGYLAEELIKNGYSVSGTCWGDAERLKPGLEIELYEVNLLDGDALKSCIEKTSPNVIFHLAAQSSGALSWKKPGLTMDINVRGCVNLLEAALELCPMAALLIIGSSEQYGESLQGRNEKITEDMPLLPTNPYAVSKAAQEQLARLYASSYGMRVITTRSFNHAGPMQSSDFALASFARQIAEIEKGIKPKELFVGNLEAMRDFTDVRDVVRAYVMLGEKGESGEAYNVGTGRAYSMQSLLDKMLAMSSESITVTKDPDRMRPSDTPLLVCGNNKLKSVTGWSPEIDIDQTLKDTLNYWRSVV